MCKFLSAISDGQGRIYYFNAKQRKMFMDGKLDGVYNIDSHTSIADFYNLNEDRCNKYEYVPTKYGMKFIVDQINTKNDSGRIRYQLEQLTEDQIITLFIYIKDFYKYRYCCDVKDRKDVWSTITDDYYKYEYCRIVKDRKELWSTITNDVYKYHYCRDVKDRKELWSTITNDDWKYEYCCNVKDRKELR